MTVWALAIPTLVPPAAWLGVAYRRVTTLAASQALELRQLRILAVSDVERARRERANVRSGNVKRVASAVGEGSIVMSLVHRVLAE